jgi:hypothetical protein
MSVNESYPVFQCPNCRQYISTKYEACRFCSFVLTDEIKARAVENETEGNRRYRSKMHKSVLYSGFGIFALGAVLSAVSVFSIFFAGEGFYFPWSPVIVLFGLGQMLIGFNGMREERKK